jgi:hypothetical protein
MSLDLSSYRDLMLSLLPELVLTGWALVLLLFVAWRHKTIRDLRIAGWLTLAALASTAVVTWWLWWNRTGVAGIAGMVAADDFRWVADWIFLAAGALTVLISFAYVEREQLPAPEYYVLLLFGTLGMMVMAAGADLMVIFLGLELMSVAVYVLAGFDRRRARSAEAALKYFLLGAFASGSLYGIAFDLWRDGTTNVGVDRRAGGHDGPPSVMLLVGLAASSGSIQSRPCHSTWAPDVYDGADTCHGVHGDRSESGRLCRAVPDHHPGLCRGAGLAGHDLVARRDHDGRRQPVRARAALAQAHARLLVGGARRLSARRGRVRDVGGDERVPRLRRGVHHDVGRRVRDPERERPER